MIYNFSEKNVICLLVTVNENKNGTQKRESNNFEVSIKLEKYSLIKINKLITINEISLFKYFEIQTENQIRRKVRKTILLKEI